MVSVGSGISFPVAWRDLPSNILVALVLVWTIVRSPEIVDLNKYRNAHGLPGGLPCMGSAATRAAHVINPGVRDIEFPFVAPDYLGLYGPIVLDTIPVKVSDPELDRWLDRGETVLMCMGTHFHYSESQVKAVINGFLGAVDHGLNTQFLWKLSNKSDHNDLIEEVLKNPKDKERFKIVDWLEADPTSIMEHTNVVAWVHHGGANSYFEGAL